MEHFTKKLNQADITFKLKHIFCQDPGCWVCAQGKGHGPYWHATYKENGQTRTVFLGKEFNPLDLNSEPDNRDKSTCSSTTSEQQSSTINNAENRFNFKTEKTTKSPDIVLGKILSDRPQNRKSQATPIPPTRFDFERDLKSLKNTLRADSLKTVYRKLTKKYHPDRYPGVRYINSWMAEINGQYSQKKRSISA
jgi:hypothetical protein